MSPSEISLIRNKVDPSSDGSYLIGKNVPDPRLHRCDRYEEGLRTDRGQVEDRLRPGGAGAAHGE